MRKILLTLMITAISWISPATSRANLCADIFEKATVTDSVSLSDLRAAYLRSYKAIVKDPTAFRASIEARSPKQRFNSATIPVPEYRSYVDYLRLALMETEKQLQIDDPQRVSRVEYLEKLIADARAINLDADGPLYGDVILLALRAAEGFDFLDTFGGRPIGHVPRKIEVRGTLIDYGSTSVNLDISRAIILPVPFPVGYASGSKLWARRIFFLGAGPDAKTGGDRSLFTDHDVFHMNLTLANTEKPLSQEQVNYFLAKFETETNNVGAKYLQSYGLSLKDRPVFLKAVEIIKFSLIHEPNINGVNPPVGRPNFYDPRGSGLFFGEAGSSGLNLGSHRQQIFEAAANWCNKFWEVNSVRD